MEIITGVLSLPSLSKEEKRTASGPEEPRIIDSRSLAKITYTVFDDISTSMSGYVNRSLGSYSLRAIIDESEGKLAINRALVKLIFLLGVPRLYDPFGALFPRRYKEGELLILQPPLY